jgi:hypothetical protein
VGLATLFVLEPRRYDRQGPPSGDAGPAHVLLVLDVSPSMRLVDAGPDRSRAACSALAT